MLADHGHVIREPREHLRAEIAKTAVAEHDDAIGRGGSGTAPESGTPRPPVR